MGKVRAAHINQAHQSLSRGIHRLQRHLLGGIQHNQTVGPSFVIPISPVRIRRSLKNLHLADGIGPEGSPEHNPVPVGGKCILGCPGSCRRSRGKGTVISRRKKGPIAGIMPVDLLGHQVSGPLINPPEPLPLPDKLHTLHMDPAHLRHAGSGGDGRQLKAGLTCPETQSSAVSSHLGCAHQENLLGLTDGSGSRIILEYPHMFHVILRLTGQKKGRHRGILLHPYQRIPVSSRGPDRADVIIIGGSLIHDIPVEGHGFLLFRPGFRRLFCLLRSFLGTGRLCACRIENP